MTTNLEIPGLAAPDVPKCTDPAELRKRAKANRGRVALLNLEVMGLAREADQLDHEAALWEVADAADAVLEVLQQQTAGIEAAAEGALAAERAAEDRLRDEKKHVARRKGEVTRAENGSREAQDEAAVRLHNSEQRMARADAELAKAIREHQEAEAVLDAHRTARREAGAACARANDAGFNPGIAPLRSTAGEAEMTSEERELLAARAGTTGGAKEPGRNRVTTRGELAAQDPNKFRFIRSGSGVNILPPSWQGTNRR